MRNSAVSDVIKVWVWALGSLLVALWLTPIALNGGEALAELSHSKDFNRVVNKLAEWSGSAGLEDFFKICWFIAAGISLFPLIEWMRLGNGSGSRKPWQIRLPHGANIAPTDGQVMVKNPWGFSQFIAGFFLTFVCFSLIGLALVRTGTFTPIENRGGWWHGLWLHIGWSILTAVCVEIFFRRVLLGIFLRAMKPASAIAMTALMFASILFIHHAFARANGIDGEGLSAGELAGIIFSGKDIFMRVVVVFLPWFALGIVLGWARWRTASMWLPTGLLSGWLVADDFFCKLTQPASATGGIRSYFVASSVHSGMTAVIVILAIGGFIHFCAHRLQIRKNDNACD